MLTPNINYRDKRAIEEKHLVRIDSFKIRIAREIAQKCRKINLLRKCKFSATYSQCAEGKVRVVDWCGISFSHCPLIANCDSNTHHHHHLLQCSVRVKLDWKCVYDCYIGSLLELQNHLGSSSEKVFSHLCTCIYVHPSLLHPSSRKLIAKTDWIGVVDWLAFTQQP